MADFVVIGMGRFGRALSRSLSMEGQAVLAVDRDRRRLDQIRTDVDATSEVDATDEEAMSALRLDRMTCAVVTIGSRAMEASILTTAILRDLEVPWIVGRAFDARHARLLLALGASEVVNPEEEMGRILALRLANPGILDQLELGEATVAEVEAPEAFAGVSIRDLDLRREYQSSVLAIRRENQALTNPHPEEALASGDVLVLLGPGEQIQKIAALR